MKFTKRILCCYKILAVLSACSATVAPGTLFASDPKIVVVGAGLGGLSAAYTLSKAGYNPVVYEGSDRIGGRCYSGQFANGQVYEHGGELIDQGHKEIRNLAQELGLTLDNVLQAEPSGLEQFFTVLDYTTNPPQPVAYSEKEASSDLTIIYSKLHSDLQACSYPTTYYQSTPRGKEIDAMGLENYINYLCEQLIPLNLSPNLAPSGAYSKLAQALKVAYNIEFGAEPYMQSPLNLLYLLGYSGPGKLRIWGPSNEKYHVRGGNDQICQALKTYLEGNGSTINTGYRLTSVERNMDTTYKVVFATATGSQTVDKIDRLILAIPFATMRAPVQSDMQPIKNANWSVDITRSSFSNLKKYAIKNLGMSDNSKMNAQFQNRFWRQDGCTGQCFGTSNPMTGTPLFTGPETVYQNTWDVTLAQPGDTGIMVNYSGGNYSRDNFLTTSNPANFDLSTFRGRRMRNTYIQNAMTQFLSTLKGTLASTPANFFYTYDQNGNINNVDINHWADSPWQRGAYSFWKVGQYAAGKATADANGNAIAFNDPVDPNNPLNFIVAFAGVESQAEPLDDSIDPILRNCHFAGEHTSYDSQGYLNGGVESGMRAANEVLYAFKKLKITPPR